MNQDNADHLNFLERYYSSVYRFYDATRKYYLLGRDVLIEEILNQKPNSIVEVGSGTGRNLEKLNQANPDLSLGGIEPCDVMRDYSERKYPWLLVSNQLAEFADLSIPLGVKPDILFFSYSLSMMLDPEGTLRHCMTNMKVGSSIYLVDFGLFSKNRFFKAAMFRWLHSFHVHPERLQEVYCNYSPLLRSTLDYWRIYKIDL